MQPSTLLLLWMLLLFSSGKMNVLENTYIFHSRLTSFPSYLFKTFDNFDKKKNHSFGFHFQLDDQMLTLTLGNIAVICQKTIS